MHFLVGLNTVRVIEVGLRGENLMTSSDSTQFARFGLFTLNMQEKQLLKAGREIKLHGQPMEVLLALVQKSGEIVPRSELQNRLWPENTYVDFEHGLNKAVSRIRIALDDSADNPRFLETIAGEGYRFIAHVVRVSATFDEAAVAIPGERRATHTNPFQRPLRAVLVGILGTALLLSSGIASYTLYRRSRAAIVELKLTSRVPELPVEAACISPDGKYIAFADHQGLWLQVVESREMHPLEAPPMSAVTRISWEPGSTALLLSARAESAKISSIWNISIFGGPPRKLRDDAGQAVASSDGTRIAFTSGDAKHVVTMTSTGEGAQEIAAAPEGDQFGALAWAAGDSGLIDERIHESSGEYNVYLELRNLTTDKVATLVAEPGLRSFCAVSDGTIIYSRLDSARNLNDTNLWRMRIDSQTGEVTQPPKQLTQWSGYSLSSLSVTTDGKRLAAEKGFTHLASYAVRLDMPEKSPDAVVRLTFHDRDDYPGSWDPGSRAVFLNSNRDGRWEIFKQDLLRHTSEYFVGSTENAKYPTLTPDGRSVLYETIPRTDTTSYTPVSLLRVSISGGPPQVVWEGNGFYRVQCSRSPANRCLLCKPGSDGKHIVISEFDPAEGKVKELGSIETEITVARLYVAWALSPNGSQMVITEAAPTGTRLRLVSLANLSEHNLDVQGWRGFQAISWTADGKGFFLLMTSENGSTILKVDAEGRVRVLREINRPIHPVCVPSPDGKWLAFAELDSNTNVVLLTGF